MNTEIIVAFIIFFALALIFYVRSYEKTSNMKEAFHQELQKNDRLFVYSDNEVLIKRLYNAGWRVKLCTACDITRDSREQGKILYGDRIFNSQFYQSEPLIVQDEDIKSVTWFNEKSIIEKVLDYEELNKLANTNKTNLRNALMIKGWRFHYSKLCEKCADQLFFIYNKGEKFDNLIVQEYQELHKHGWHNIYTRDKIEEVLDIFSLYELLDKKLDE